MPGLARRRSELQARRERLRLRSAELRLLIGRDARALEAPLALADRVRTGLLWLRDNPVWPMGAVALLVARRPRRALRWTARLWGGWMLWRRAARVLRVAQVFVQPRR